MCFEISYEFCLILYSFKFLEKNEFEECVMGIVYGSIFSVFKQVNIELVEEINYLDIPLCFEVFECVIYLRVYGLFGDMLSACRHSICLQAMGSLTLPTAIYLLVIN